MDFEPHFLKNKKMSDDSDLSAIMLPPCMDVKHHKHFGKDFVEELSEKYWLDGSQDSTLLADLKAFCDANEDTCAPLSRWKTMIDIARKVPHTRHFNGAEMNRLLGERRVDGVSAFVGGSRPISAYEFAFDVQHDCDVARATVDISCFVDCYNNNDCAFDLDITVPLDSKQLRRIELTTQFASRSYAEFTIDDQRFDRAEFRLLHDPDGVEVIGLRARLLSTGVPSSHLQFSQAKLQLAFPIGKILGTQTFDLPQSVHYRATVCYLPWQVSRDMFWKCLVVYSPLGVWFATTGTLHRAVADGQLVYPSGCLKGNCIPGVEGVVGSEGFPERALIGPKALAKLLECDPKDIQRALAEAEMKS